MTLNLNIGDSVIKKSKRPFKSGLQVETIDGFSINEVDPKKRECVVFKDGSICNICMINKVETDPTSTYEVTMGEFKFLNY